MRTTQNTRQIGRPAKAVVIGCAMLTAIFISGLQYFVLNLPDYKAAQTKPSDGIVVITGGQQRLDAGLSLLANGAASKLLISGVGTGLSKAILANDLQLDPSFLLSIRLSVSLCICASVHACVRQSICSCIFLSCACMALIYPFVRLLYFGLFLFRQKLKV